MENRILSLLPDETGKKLIITFGDGSTQSLPLDELARILASIGDLTDLDTTVKSSLVAAVNEVYGKIDADLESAILDFVSDHQADILALLTATDPTLTQANKPADAKATGDEIAGLKEALSDKTIDILEQGTIDSNGHNADSTAYVRTKDYLDLSLLNNVYKPIGVSCAIFFYKDPTALDNGLLGTQSPSVNSEYNQKPYKAEYSTATHVRLRFSDGSDPVLPANIVIDGVKIDLLISSFDLKKEIETAEGNIASDKTELETKITTVDDKYKKYTVVDADFIQGSISATTGKIVDASTEYVRTEKFLPVIDLNKIYKSATASVYIFLYSSDSDTAYLSDHMDYTNASTATITSADIVSHNQNATHFLVRAKRRGESTTTPAQFIATGSYASVYKSNKEIIEETDYKIINLPSVKQYFELKNTELTEGTYTYNINLDTEKYKPMIIRCSAKYTGDNPPTIKVKKDWLGPNGTTYGNYYATNAFPFGGKNGQYIEKAWRVMPFIDGCRDYITVEITVPENTTLTIKNLHNEFESAITRYDPGIRLNGHGVGGFGGPANVMATFNMIHKLGYETCITIPKVTKDGVYVCLHNDDNIGTIVYYDDGTQVDSSVYSHPVSYFNYSELLQFDFGLYRGYPFKYERIPKLEDFFILCAKTGMKPMLSVHPSLEGHWSNIKTLAKNCGVLSKLGIKSAYNVINIPMAVLGDEVESYTIDTHATTTEVMNTVISAFNDYKTQYNITKARCVIEGMEPEVWTDDNIALVKTAGYELAMVNTRDVDLMMEMIGKGVHEFTEDYNSSNGLNW